MVPKYLCVFYIIALFSSKMKGQVRTNYPISDIDSLMISQANAVVRSEMITINFKDLSTVVVRKKRTVTILNPSGKKVINFQEFYDPYTKIKKLNAKIFNAKGIFIKEFKKAEFVDVGAYDGVSFVIEDRVKYLQYIPQKYPFTIVLESEIERKSTALIPLWNPIPNHHISVEKSTYKIINAIQHELRFKEKNLYDYAINVERMNGTTSYSIENVLAIVPEEYSPHISKIVPSVRVFPTIFSLKGIEGTANNWESFGEWYYKDLLSNRIMLSEETIQEIENIVGHVQDTIEKIELIHKYVQNKTHYVSIQLGIGGWKPFPASDVDRLGYGDCKALTNYMHALLSSQGITSYHTLVYGSTDHILHIDKDFTAIEGNHMILNVPINDEDYWIECTSQTAPFDYIAKFTDDRDVLVITPEKGVIKHTTKYPYEKNRIISKGLFKLDSFGAIDGTVQLESSGTTYSDHYMLQSKSIDEKKFHYRNYWRHLNNVQLKNFNFLNNKKEVTFTETLDLEVKNYARKVGSRFLFNPNILNRQVNLPKIYKNRKYPLVLPRGEVKEDIVKIHLPSGYLINVLPPRKKIESTFGTYVWELKLINNDLLQFKRILEIKDGTFSKETYAEYRQFLSEIQKVDNSKILIQQL